MTEQTSMGLDGKIVAFEGMRGAQWMGGAGFCLLRREVYRRVRLL